MDSPSFTDSWTFAMASEMTTLPAVSRVMLRAWRMGTPEVTRVPSVRVKREIALFHGVLRLFVGRHDRMVTR